MTDLTAFLLARIAEDEAAARACAEAFPSPWEVVDRGHSATVKADAPNFWVVSAIDQEQETPGRWPGEHLEHIARHDPARVLAQCAAYRAIVEQWRESQISAESDDGGPWSEGMAYAGELALRALASIWGDHPAYEAEWGLS